LGADNDLAKVGSQGITDILHVLEKRLDPEAVGEQFAALRAVCRFLGRKFDQ
jgi:hypothetical protein